MPTSGYVSSFSQTLPIYADKTLYTKYVIHLVNIMLLEKCYWFFQNIYFYQ